MKGLRLRQHKNYVTSLRNRNGRRNPNRITLPEFVWDLEFVIWNLQCWAFHWKLEIGN